ncbi:MAG TPA: SDR family oxidoreductase [Steroidobacteraceae bacterium]|nr:SDR family oxidoreductase [Steroidobacteraceae bacterium]
MNPKRAIVTGGSTGIGVAICHELLERGYEVIALSRREAGLTSPRLRSVRVDLSDTAATRAAVEEIAASAPATTIVHNAGAIREKPLEEVDLEDLETLTHLHVSAPVLLVQANLAAMRAAGYGRIVLVSSRAVLGLARRTAYAATKAAMLGLARTWALELGPAGITVNVVAPGPIEETEMFHAVIAKGSPRHQSLAQSLPVRRIGRPADVARAVTFFTDPEAGFVTGQTLYVCGGASAGGAVL